MIPYGRQSIDDADIAAVVEVLRSDWLTSGPAVEAFERALAEYCGAHHAVAVANGTAALHLAVLAAGLGPGQRVLTSANTFLASANCAEFAGTTADFADIDSGSRCVSGATLEAAWRDDIKAVVAVDFAGYPCVSRELGDRVRERGAVLIEDACHAIGGARDGFKLGALPWVDMTIFSFHPVKTMTTGEGGAILTDRGDLADRCRRLRNHGMVKGVSAYRSVGVSGRQRHRNSEPPKPRYPDSATGEPGPWYYEMPELGFNYRITDLQCALGRSQLRKLDDFVARRQTIVDRYNEAFEDLPHTQTPIHRYPDTLRPAWHLYVLEIDFDALGKSRGQVMRELRERDISTQVHYIPVHLQPYYRDKYGYAPGKCPVAERYYQRALSVPLYPGLTDEDVQRVVRAMRDVVSGS